MSFEDDVRRQVTPRFYGDQPPTPRGGLTWWGVFFAVLAALWVWKHCGSDAPAARATPELPRTTTTRGAR